ncbi:DUF4116 domain-containing protein [Sulfurimonas sp. SAG-AH-194-C20]|nr:DUF4116 domain-containing protein [Sulfurimonas sp. SAG-AH-194-C20]MDF1878412.1 DUF4116 domain-containing protein [Sulfurimonas sp. SAG-AH-194-C20]
MAKPSNKKIVDALTNIRWDADFFDPKNGNFDSIYYSDKTLFTYALLVNGDVLQYASDEFKADAEMVGVAISSSISSFAYIDEKFKHDKEFILKHCDYNVLEYLPDEILLDKKFLMNYDVEDLAVLLETKPHLYKDDREFILKILQNNGNALRHLSADMQNDFEMAKASVLNNSHAYQHIGNKLKDNEELLKLAIKWNGDILEYAIDKFKQDKEIAKIAVSNNASAICFLPKEFQSDKELISLALGSRMNVSDAMLSINKEVFKDREFSKRLMYINEAIFDYFDSELQKDTEFKLIKKIQEI